MKMKLITAALALSAAASAQNSVDFELGNGLAFDYSNGAYEMSIGGMFQPYFSLSQVSSETNELFLNTRYSYFNLKGKAVEEGLSFFIQGDFSRPDLLLDGYFSYAPVEALTFHFGQKQTPANNREMLAMESHIQLTERSLVSTELSRTGREFGMFLDGRLELGKMLFAPQLALTSGDGINSFGLDSRDPDLGGVKVAGRLDWYPLGEFSAGNGAGAADLVGESRMLMVLGVAGSINHGASQSVGEGHGNFELFNSQGDLLLPDYRQLYADLLLKYRGWSLLAETGIGTAANLDEIFVNPVNNTLLAPGQISSYLMLGQAYNVHLGKVWSSGWGVDVRVSGLTPEFGDYSQSIAEDMRAITLGGSRYILGDAAKIQLSATQLTVGNGDPLWSGVLVMQIIL